MEKLSFRLEKFEGPLDVLVYLISKNKLNICDISISELLDQYLAYLDSMREMDLEVTSEFLEMASRLVQIKSATLLPKEEDGPDAGKELITALIEYKTCKALAGALRERATGFDAITRPPAEIEPDFTYRLRHRPEELLRAFCAVAVKAKRRRAPMETAFREIVGRKIVSVASRVVHIIRLLSKEGKRSFRSLFVGAGGRSEAVATFLAVLELVKAGTIRVGDGGEVSFSGRHKIRHGKRNP